MVKKIEKQNNSVKATTQETATGVDKIGSESAQTGGMDVEKQENTTVDKRSKTATTAKKRFLEEITLIAARTFQRIQEDKLYFTSDKQGFADKKNAENYASQLNDSTIVEINK
ncbi:MAG: hypothetical protein PHQ33_08390, partial [Bacteroidales bacterium]|nr:hypothetical protein [Bacteroidales bacterium]